MKIERSLAAALLCVAGVLPLSAHAQDSGDMQNCMALDDANARLACFEGIAGNNPASESGVTDAVGSNWLFEEGTDSLSGSIPVARNTAIRMEPDNQPITEMHIRCQNGTVEGFLVWGTRIAPDDAMSYPAHMYRLDGQPVVETGRWSPSSTKTATFFTRETSLFVSLMSASEFVVRIQPQGQMPITATFDVSGGAEPIGRVLDACGVAVDQVGKQGFWGIESQPVGELAPATSNSAVPSAPSGYVPSNSWRFTTSNNIGYAFVDSQSGQSSLVLECSPGGVGIMLTLTTPEGWRANQPVAVEIDGRSIPVRAIGGGEDVGFTDAPGNGLAVTREVIDLLASGSTVSLTGGATANMTDGARIFSLLGSSAAVRQLLNHCGL